ncbi:MAG: hypothetical protein QXT99_10050, partial [Candidatus Nitrosotenuis sp.]
IGYGSPVTILTGHLTERDIRIAGSICARYSDGRQMPDLKVRIEKKVAGTEYISVIPADDILLNTLRIQPPERKGNKRTSLVNASSYKSTDLIHKG